MYTLYPLLNNSKQNPDKEFFVAQHFTQCLVFFASFLSIKPTPLTPNPTDCPDFQGVHERRRREPSRVPEQEALESGRVEIRQHHRLTSNRLPGFGKFKSLTYYYA